MNYKSGSAAVTQTRTSSACVYRIWEKRRYCVCSSQSRDRV